MRKTALIFLLTFAFPTSSYALTLSEWEHQGADWKQAYVFAIMEAISSLADSDSPHSMARAKGYRACFTENKFNSESGTKLVGRYILMNPSSSSEAMIATVAKAMKEACGRYLP